MKVTEELLQQQERVKNMQNIADPEITMTTEYYTSEGTTLAIDIYQPDPELFPGVRPAVLFFFGGGFRIGWRKAFNRQASECARMGFTAFCADYRILAEHGSSAWESIRDGANAWLFVRENAARFRIDPDRIFLSGGSAGGLVAIMCGRVTGIQSAGLVLFNPAIADAGDAAMKELLTSDTWPAGISPVSAGSIDPDMPPVLILHGEDDTTVPIAGIRRFCKNAIDAGRDVTLIAYPGAAHGFFNIFRSRVFFHLTTGELLRFLMQHSC